METVPLQALDRFLLCASLPFRVTKSRAMSQI